MGSRRSKYRRRELRRRGVRRNRRSRPVFVEANYSSGDGGEIGKPRHFLKRTRRTRKEMLSTQTAGIILVDGNLVFPKKKRPAWWRIIRLVKWWWNPRRSPSSDVVSWLYLLSRHNPLVLFWTDNDSRTNVRRKPEVVRTLFHRDTEQFRSVSALVTAIDRRPEIRDVVTNRPYVAEASTLVRLYNGR